jgi:hypothetical protein
MQKILALAFLLGLRLNARVTRSTRLRAVEGRALTPFFVWLTRVIRGRPPAGPPRTPDDLGREWERLLGDRRYARVVRVDAETSTVHGEITGRCPLRGTGDVAACHRLMAYDRGLMDPLGGRFIVLASQAEPGRVACSVAIRPASLPHADLVPAHLAPRYPQG